MNSDNKKKAIGSIYYGDSKASTHIFLSTYLNVFFLFNMK